MNAGGSPDRSAARAGAAYGDTSGPPRASPSSAVQPTSLAARSQTPRPAICRDDGVSLRSSSIGQTSSWPSSAGPPRSRASSATAAASPPPALTAADDDPGRVDAELGGVRRRPGQARVAVLDRPGMRGLRGEPVLHRDDGEPELLGVVQHAEEAAAAVVAEDHAAAVDEVEAATARGTPAGRQISSGTSGAPAGPGTCRGAHLERAAAPQVLVGGRRDQRRRLPDQRDVRQGELGAPGRRHRVERGPQLGVERGRRPDLSRLRVLRSPGSRSRGLLRVDDTSAGR